MKYSRNAAWALHFKHGENEGGLEDEKHLVWCAKKSSVLQCFSASN